MAPLTKLHGAFTETEGDGEIIIMRLETGEFLSLTGTAAKAWTLIDGKHDRDTLLDALAAEYSLRPCDISSEVDQFLDELRRSGLLADE